MALPTSKPHVWVKTASQKISVKLKCPGAYTGFNFQYVTAQDLDLPNNRISIRCVLDTSNNATGDYDLSANGDYAPGMKVTMKVMDVTTLKGLMTVKPDPTSNFTILADVATYKPFCWMEYINTSVSKLHVNVQLPAHRRFLLDAQGYIQPDIVIDNYQNHTRTITCNLISANTIRATTFDEVYVLDVTTGYDPILEDIILIIKDNPGGVFIEESKATSTESEADASGGGGNGN